MVSTFHNAATSGAEHEPTAATILWIIATILVLGGGTVYNLRRRRLMD